jgi:7,8-dihydropterin-6-yl-methyl-4-(beta-D-ribofuranosyl)aminobenzene 5'-phosphate synthase
MGQGSQECAEALGIALARADAVVLSHGHYDHTGGLAAALQGRHRVPVYAQPEACSGSSR